MNPKLLLRIAAVLILFHCFGHTLYICTWTQTTDYVQNQVVKQMTVHQFPFGGTNRSMADYYNGFGYIITLVFMMMAILVWILSGGKAQADNTSKSMLLAIGFCLAAIGITELMYFFPLVAGQSLVAAALILFVGFKTKHTELKTT